ncbi:MAG: tetratricopeptide repeat protein [Candidatus Zixiibacteriota bacterium]
MKRLIVCALVLSGIFILTAPQATHAQDAPSVFARSVDAYQRDQFDSARTGFEQLVQAGIDDPRVWHNLGNCYYKTGRIGEALVAYKRGLRIAPRDADLDANFRFVRLYAVDKIEPVGEFFLEEWWRAFVSNFSVYETRWVAGLVFWIAAAITAWLLWPGRLRVPVWPIVTVWLLWAVSTGAAATAYSRDYQTRSGAIVVTETEVRAGPGEDYAVQFVAHDGLLGVAERAESGWFLVRFPNGLKGWVPVATFKVI